MVDNSLVLPGDIPRLLRRSSPVVAYSTKPDVVYEVDGNDFNLRHGWVAAWNLELDLTDATGRAHAAWWLDMKVRGVSLAAAALREQPEWWNEEQRCHPAFAALADLDPEDPRLLPDGSRWVDAEALRRVCLHVAGL